MVFYHLFPPVRKFRPSHLPASALVKGVVTCCFMVLFVAAFLTIFGCANPAVFRAEHIKIETDYRDGAHMKVSKTWLEEDGGQLVLAGYVKRTPPWVDTTQSSLQILIFNRRGEQISELKTVQSPAQIPLARHGSRYSSFRVPLPLDRAEIQRVVVRTVEAGSL